MKRIISLAIALLMLLPIAASCAAKQTEASSQQTTVGEAAVSETTSVTETENPYDPKLPEMDFNGNNFHFLNADGGSLTGYINNDIYVEQEVGEPINDSVFKRNRTIEEKYNVLITEDRDLYPVTNILKKQLLAGEDVYDVVVDSVMSFKPLADSGQLADFYELPYVDLTQIWWNVNAVKGYSLANRYYFAVNDLMLNDKQRTYCTIFSKDIAEKQSFGNLYELVDNGAWTIDKMSTMAKATAADLNGDGLVDDKDMFGVSTECYSIICLMSSSGVRITSKDSDDIPILCLNSEKTTSVIDKVLYLLCDSVSSALAENYKTAEGKVNYRIGMDSYEDGRCLFLIGMFGWVQTVIKNSEVNTGVLPLPKYDEAQKQYTSMTQATQTNSIAVPITNADTEMTGFLLEAMTAESRATVLPAYYDVVVKTKYTTDTESVRMIELILDNLVYELGLIYDWGGLSDMLRQMAQKGENTFASSYAKAESKILTQMEKTITAFTESAAG